MAIKHIVGTCPNGKSVNLVIFENDIWISQFELAVLFESSIKTINEHTSAIAVTPELKRQFDIEKTEGSRRIRRRVVHFGLDVSHQIAIRSRRWSEHTWLIETANFLGVTKSHFLVHPVKERHFEELLFGVFDGLCQIQRQYPVGQYRIDFYIPSLRLAIEYDEKHHLNSPNQNRDRQREFEIAAILDGIEFIRVQEGSEIQGINLVVRRLITGISLAASSSPPAE
ncbi:DUF559 domain-containing protein [Schlesneria paludicola]|uniref:DUF559 domain-containing protein n=1 Tax=Schlesneria paludicola TaxID=360056 RepID=UPI00029B2DEF